MRVSSLISVSVLALGFAAPAMAQDRSFNFSLRAGASYAPEYFGSDSYEVSPDFGFSFGSLRLGGLDIGNGVRGIPDDGFSFSGALKVIGDREADDSPELAGLEDIDTAVELGVGVKFQQRHWSAFAEVRKGVTGHNGVTGTVGADFIFRPSDRWVITAGPRMEFGDDEFTDTYFGVPAGTTSTFGVFDAGSGAYSGGVEAAATYFIGDAWALEGAVTYDKLLNGAGDSPITQNGSDNQWSLSLGLSRSFTLNF